MEIMGKEVLWIRNEGLSMKTVIRVGITERLTNILNSIKAIRLLSEGRCVNEDFPFALIEYGKRKILLKSPISGFILEVNKEVLKNPQLINNDPYGKGWLALIKPTP
ncbi:MAG: hypothetical protein QW372_02715 [Nitrososphaerales archaeon]